MKNEIQSQGWVSDPNNLLVALKNNIQTLSTSYDNFIQNPNTIPSGFTLDRVLQQQATLDNIESMISNIENSHARFRIESNPNAISSELSKDLSTGEYVITIKPSLNSYENDGLLVHELFHAYSILNGTIGFDGQGHATMIGMEDEIGAYQLQYDFNSGLTARTTITETFINQTYPGIYNNLPQNGGKCPVHG